MFGTVFVVNVFKAYLFVIWSGYAHALLRTVLFCFSSQPDMGSALCTRMTPLFIVWQARSTIYLQMLKLYESCMYCKKG
jgi:hypothetical protein